jgi:hypothetical protein
MQKNNTGDTGNNTVPLLVLALVVLGFKILLIACFGSALPIQDQWSVEGLATLAPWHAGTLHARDLLDAHGEHRLVLTRLLDIIMLELNGGLWNPLLQMLVNALLHVMALLVMLRMLLTGVSGWKKALLLVAAATLFSLPLASDNTLNSFQSQVYLLLLFSFVFIHSICTQPVLAPRWWLGLVCGVMACLASAGGAVALAAGALLQLARARAEPTASARRWLAIALLGTLAIVVIVTTPHTPPIIGLTLEHGHLQARRLMPHADSPGEFMAALASVLSWPVPAPLPIACLPLLLFMLRLLRKPAAAAHQDWIIFGSGLWLLLQLLAIAFERGKFPLESRYVDYFCIGLLLSFRCLLVSSTPSGTAAKTAPPSPRRWPAWSWVALITAALVLQTSYHLLALATVQAPVMQATENQVRHYLETGASAELRRNDYPQLPRIISPEEMQTLLDTPALRAILPPELFPAHAPQQPGWVTALLARLPSLGLLLLTLGLALTLWMVQRQPARPEQQEPSC